MDQNQVDQFRAAYQFYRRTDAQQLIDSYRRCYQQLHFALNQQLHKSPALAATRRCAATLLQRYSIGILAAAQKDADEFRLATQEKPLDTEDCL